MLDAGVKVVADAIKVAVGDVLLLAELPDDGRDFRIVGVIYPWE